MSTFLPATLSSADRCTAPTARSHPDRSLAHVALLSATLLRGKESHTSLLKYRQEFLSDVCIYRAAATTVLCEEREEVLQSQA